MAFGDASGQFRWRKVFCQAASMLKRAPVSCFHAALRISRRAASNFSGHVVASIIESLETPRWDAEGKAFLEYSNAASKAPLRDAGACAAIPMRPPSSVERATVYPSPRCQCDCLPALRNRWKTSPQQAVALMPVFFFLANLKAGVPFLRPLR